jgi:hypothetical protein
MFTWWPSRLITISDKGGDGDMLTVYDRPDRTAGSF